MPSRIHSLYGCAALSPLLTAVSSRNSPGGGVDEQEPPGLQSPLPGDLFLGEIEHAGLRRHDHEAVLGHEIAGGAKAVAVERRTDDPPVGEGDRCRSVPRLEQRAVKLVEGAALVVHQRVLVPRLGDHHHHRVLDRPA